MRSKADFRPLRETVGMSRDMLATRMDVAVRSVKRWETPSEPHQPPAEAWEILEAARERQLQIVERYIDAAEYYSAGSDEIGVTYWPNAETFRQAHPDGSRDSYTMANATARLIAHELEMLGYEVTFGFGGLAGLTGGSK